MGNLTRADGVRIWFAHVSGQGPTLVFLPGYASDMEGTKALALAEWARANDRAMLRLDYSGCGESGGRFEDGTLDIWRDDVLSVLGQVTGPVVLVGSSMGGWLMLLVALALPSRVVGLVGIAAAPDFTDWGFSEPDKLGIERDGRMERASDHGDPMVTTAGFWRSGQANLLLNDAIVIDCPVRLLHGQADPDVPWETSLHIVRQLRSHDVQVILVKDGDHRLSRAQDIGLLLATVEALLDIL